MAQIAAFLMLLGHRRGLFVLLENPAGSMIFNYCYLKWVLDYLAESLTDLYRIVTPHCAFQPGIKRGLRTFKPFKLLAIGPVRFDWIARLKKTCPCQGFGHIALMEPNAQGKPCGALPVASRRSGRGAATIGRLPSAKPSGTPRWSTLNPSSW